jgi:hypothetical protein
MKIALLSRFLLLVGIAMAPILFGGLANWPRLIIVLAYVAALMAPGRAYAKSLAGKLELVGSLLLGLVFIGTAILIAVYKTEALGVLFGGVLGMSYLAALGLCVLGLLLALLKGEPKQVGSDPRRQP